MANSRETLHNEPHNRRTAIRSDENSHRKIENRKKVFSNQLQNKRNKRVKRVRIKGQKGIYCQNLSFRDMKRQVWLATKVLSCKYGKNKSRKKTEYFLPA
ncbi:MAG: hypothetical protein SOV83_02350 [Prevotella sp.]|nr:hypothetical protein [Prevotella sp.]